MMDHKKVQIHSIKKCNVSGDTDLIELWNLPKYPLTEQFGKFEKNFPRFSQSLIISSKAGHVQLKNHIDPNFLYSPLNYSYRTTLSRSKKFACDIFIDFFKKIVKGKKLISIVDIGGNDNYIMERVSKKTSFKYVIDPVGIQKDNGIVVINKFIHEVDFRENINTPDAVICRHTLEHLPDPKKILEKLINECSVNCIFVFEVPSLEKMLEAHRFDTIMHQHVNYFDINSLKYLLNEISAELLDYQYFNEGSCGGSILFAFKRKIKVNKKIKFSLKFKIEMIKKKIVLFQNEMNYLNEVINNTKDKFIGYGAGLMLSTYLYHLNINTSRIKYIIDDDIHKNNMGYKNINLKVKFLKNNEIPVNTNFLITSLENKKIILSKILNLKANKILFPSIV